MAFNPWRLAWLAGDPVVRATMELRTAMYDGVWNAMYFLLIIGFFIANTLYSVAMWRGRGLTRVVGIFYAAAALLTLQIIVVEMGGGQLLPDAISFWAPPFDPASRPDADRRLAMEALKRERCACVLLPRSPAPCSNASRHTIMSSKFDRARCAWPPIRE